MIKEVITRRKLRKSTNTPIDANSGASNCSLDRAVPNKRRVDPSQARHLEGKEALKYERSSANNNRIGCVRLLNADDDLACVESRASKEDTGPSRARPTNGTSASIRAGLLEGKLIPECKGSNMSEEKPRWAGFLDNGNGLVWTGSDIGKEDTEPICNTLWGWPRQ